MSNQPPRGFYVGEPLRFTVRVTDVETSAPVSLDTGLDEGVFLSALNLGGENQLSDPVPMPEAEDQPGTYRVVHVLGDLEVGTYDVVMTIQGPLGPQYETDRFVLFPEPV